MLCLCLVNSRGHSAHAFYISTFSDHKSRQEVHEILCQTTDSSEGPKSSDGPRGYKEVKRDPNGPPQKGTPNGTQMGPQRAPLKWVPGPLDPLFGAPLDPIWGPCFLGPRDPFLFVWSALGPIWELLDFGPILALAAIPFWGAIRLRDFFLNFRHPSCGA